MTLLAALLAALGPAQAVPDGYRPPPELQHLPSARCLRFEGPNRERRPRSESELLAQLDAAIDYCMPPRDQAVRATAAALARTRPAASPEALRAEAGRMLDEWRAHFRLEMARNNSFLWDATGTGTEDKAESGAEDGLGRMYLSPERFSDHRRMGFMWCGWSRWPDECHSAYLAASYSSSTAELCWNRASEPYAGGRYHGGTSTTWVQEQIAMKCRAPIRMCRENWRHFFDLQPAAESPSRTERQQAIIRDNLNGLCLREPPEEASADGTVR